MQATIFMTMIKQSSQTRLRSVCVCGGGGGRGKAAEKSTGKYNKKTGNKLGQLISTDQEFLTKTRKYKINQ